MSDATPAPDAPAADEATPTTDAAPDAPVAGEEALGDAGKKALDAMKAERKAARDEAAAVRAELDAIKAKLEGKEAEHAAEQERRELEKAALAKADERILKAEIRAAGAAKLADPADALRFLNVSDFEVGSDGEVDAQAIGAAIDDLIASKPYLAAQGGRKFQGSADGGARNDATKPTQLTRADLASMSPEQVDAAHNEGRLSDLLGA